MIIALGKKRTPIRSWLSNMQLAQIMQNNKYGVNQQSHDEAGKKRKN